MRRLHFPALLVACFVFGYAVVPSHASTVHAPPQAPCTFENRMDLVITGQGVWFECVCEALQVGTVCDWYELGPAPDARAARKRWNYVPASTQRQLLTRHSWPRFLSPRRFPAPPKPVVVTTPLLTAPVTTTGTKCTDPYLADDAWAQAHGC